MNKKTYRVVVTQKLPHGGWGAPSSWTYGEDLNAARKEFFEMLSKVHNEIEPVMIELIDNENNKLISFVLNYTDGE